MSLKKTILYIFVLLSLCLCGCGQRAKQPISSASASISQNSSVIQSTEESAVSAQSSTTPSSSKETVSSAPQSHNQSTPSSAATSNSSPVSEPVVQATVTLQITTPDGPFATAELALEAEDTAFSVLKRYADENNIKLEYTSFGGAYVSAFGGYRQRASGHPASGWLYYVNGEKPNKSSSKILLKDGDTVLWKYSYTALAE